MNKKKLTPEEQFYIDEQMYFTEELNNESDEQIKEFHVEQKKNRDGILAEIAKVMLSYNVVNEIMNIKSSDQKVLEAKLINMVNEKVQSELNSETKLTGGLLRSIGKEKYSVNNYIYSLGSEDKKEPSNNKKTKDSEVYQKHTNSAIKTSNDDNVIAPKNIKENTLDDIINRKVDEKLWSDRLWANKNEIAKDLRAEIRDFIDGKTTVNEIENRMKKKYNTNANETKRLVQDNVARVQEGVNEQWREDNDIKYVLYMATLCNNTCTNCSQYDGKSYEVSKKPVSLPQHCYCRCTYVNIPNPDWHPKMRLDNETKKNVSWQSYEDWKENKVKPMNLQLFGINEKEELNKLISTGVIKKDEYDKCYDHFKESFKNGIETPIGNVYNKGDRYTHIVRRHTDMLSFKEIDNVVKSLQSPDVIYKTKDKFGSEGMGYIKNIDNNELLTIVKDGIITSYYPSKNYLNKMKRGEIVWQKK